MFDCFLSGNSAFAWERCRSQISGVHFWGLATNWIAVVLLLLRRKQEVGALHIPSPKLAKAPFQVSRISLSLPSNTSGSRQLTVDILRARPTTFSPLLFHFSAELRLDWWRSTWKRMTQPFLTLISSRALKWAVVKSVFAECSIVCEVDQGSSSEDENGPRPKRRWQLWEYCCPAQNDYGKGQPRLVHVHVIHVLTKPHRDHRKVFLFLLTEVKICMLQTVCIKRRLL